MPVVTPRPKILYAFALGVVLSSVVACASLSIRALGYYAIALYVTLLLFLPGFALATLFLRDLSVGERLAIGPALTIPILAMAILTTSNLGELRDSATLVVNLILLLTSTLVLVVHRRQVTIRKSDLTGLTVTMLVFFSAISLIAIPIVFNDIPFMRPDIGANLTLTRVPFLPQDAYLPYRLVQFVLNRLDPSKDAFFYQWSIAERTPLMGLVASFFFSSLRVQPPAAYLPYNPASFPFDGGYYIFWIVGTLLDSLFVLSFYVFAGSLVNGRVAKLSLLILALNPYTLWSAFYTSPKAMAAYFVFLAAYMVVTDRHYILAGMFAGLAVLSHSYAALFVFGILLYLMARRGRFKSLKARLVKLLLPMALVLLPWSFWTTFVIHQSSRLVYMPLFVPGSNLLSAHFSEIHFDRVWSDFVRTPLTLIVWTRIVNLLRALLPYRLTATEFYVADPTALNNMIHGALLRTYFNIVPAAATYTVTLFAIIGFCRNKKLFKQIFLLGIVPAAMNIFLFGYPLDDFVAVGLLPLIPMITLAATEVVQRSKLLLATLLAGVTLEYLYVVWVGLYPFWVLPRGLTSSEAFIYLVGTIVPTLILIYWTFSLRDHTSATEQFEVDQRTA